MSSYKNTFLYLSTYPLSILSRIFPKDRGVWLFGSWSGTQYNDNSKYLFRYVNKYCPGVRAVWLTRSKDTLITIRNEGHECHLMYSPAGILATLRAYVAIISRAKAEDLPIYISPYTTKIVQLWHGTPLKKLGIDKENSTINNKNGTATLLAKLIRRVFFPQSNNNYSIFIASSKETGRLLESAYGHWMKPDAIKITGYPRNDALHGKFSAGVTKRGIYLPTFRDWDRNGETLFNSYGFDAKKMDVALSKMDVKLDMKLHPETALPEHVLSVLNNSQSITFVNYSDIYEHLGKYDFIITDYSSIYFDYLILDRPIIFAPFDLKQYVSGRGLYFNYHDVTPGIKAYSWDDVLEEIEVVVGSVDDFKGQREKINSRFNTYCDANSCQRVVDEIRKL